MGVSGVRACRRWVYDEFLDDTSLFAGTVMGGIAAVYLPHALPGGAVDVLKCARFLILPVACILLPDALERYRGWAAGHKFITRGTPAIVIRGGGWFLLLLPVLIWLVQ